MFTLFLIRANYWRLANYVLKSKIDIYQTLDIFIVMQHDLYFVTAVIYIVELSAVIFKRDLSATDGRISQFLNVVTY